MGVGVDALLTAEQLAKIFGVRRKTLYVWVARREIPFVKLPGNTTRFPEKQVRAWLERRSSGGKPLDKATYL